MRKTVEYTAILEEGVRRYHYHEREKNEILRFVIQLEIFSENLWQPVVRYDCAHGFAHKDQYFPDGTKTKISLGLDFRSAFAFADWDIKNNCR